MVNRALADHVWSFPQLETRKNRYRFGGYDDSLKGRDHGGHHGKHTPSTAAELGQAARAT